MGLSKTEYLWLIVDAFVKYLMDLRVESFDGSHHIDTPIIILPPNVPLSILVDTTEIVLSIDFQFAQELMNFSFPLLIIESSLRIFRRSKLNKRFGENKRRI